MPPYEQPKEHLPATGPVLTATGLPPPTGTATSVTMTSPLLAPPTDSADNTLSCSLEDWDELLFDAFNFMDDLPDMLPF